MANLTSSKPMDKVWEYIKGISLFVGVSLGYLAAAIGFILLLLYLITLLYQAIV